MKKYFFIKKFKINDASRAQRAAPLQIISMLAIYSATPL
jgi:hypothetical protein